MAARRATLVAAASLVLGSCSDAILSPRARDTRILFTRVDERLRTISMRTDGTGSVVLTPNLGADLLPVLSPDGHRVAFVAGNTQVFVMNIDGSERRQVTTQAGGAAWHSWTPDGNAIVFGTQRDRDIRRIALDGTPAVRIGPAGGDALYPALSPDGQRIAFATTRHFTLGSQVMELYVMNVDGTGMRRLTYTDAWFAVNAFPAWSPDSRRIAFIRAVESGVPHVWVVDADGGNERQLLGGSAPERWVTWSPDGRYIAFSRQVGLNGDIFIARASDGGAVTNLTQTPYADELYPHWGVVR